MQTANTIWVKSIQKMDTVFAAISAATNLPYMEHDPETGDDQVYLFSSADELKAFIEENKQKIALFGTKITKVDMLGFYANLNGLGVTRVAMQKGGEILLVPLSAIANIQTPKAPEGIPSENKELQRAAIYFLQELRGLYSDEGKRERLIELETAMLEKMVESTFLLPYREEEGKEKADKDGRIDPMNIRFLYITGKNGAPMQPFFSDCEEFKRFAGKEKGLRMLAVSFEQLPDFTSEHVDTLLFNPAGVCLPFEKDYIRDIIEE